MYIDDKRFERAQNKFDQIPLLQMLTCRLSSTLVFCTFTSVVINIIKYKLNLTVNTVRQLPEVESKSVNVEKPASMKKYLLSLPPLKDNSYYSLSF